MLNDLKCCLIGSQIDFISLDNFMENNNFYSISADGVLDNIKNNKNIYYISTKEDKDNILITFDLISNNYLDDSDNFYLEVTGIELA